MTRNRLLATRTLLPLSIRRIAYLSLLWIAGSFSPATAGTPNATGGEIRPAVLYHNYCSVCHGDKGDGKSRAQNSLNPPPRDFTTPSAAQITRASMIDAVKNGRPGTAMTPWKSVLNQKEIEAIVDYVRNKLMPASGASDNSRGRIVYSKNCSVCHGEKGDGKSRAQYSLNPPPRDFTSPATRSELTKERMITSITFGRADTAMTGFKTHLSKEDISMVVEYIRTGFMASADTDGISGIQNSRNHAEHNGATAPKTIPVVAKTETAHTQKHVHNPVTVSMSVPMPHALKGDTNKGKTFYMDNCATCHGKTGNGRGPRAYFINPKPRNFLHPASRQVLNRVELFEMISEGRPGTEMPAWNKVLNPQEIANVAEFVFQSFIQAKVNTKPAKAAK